MSVRQLAYIVKNYCCCPGLRKHCIEVGAVIPSDMTLCKLRLQPFLDKLGVHAFGGFHDLTD